MKGIKNELSKSLKNNRYYNPNTFNSVDSLIAYIIALILLFGIGKLVAIPVKILVSNKILTDYFLIQILLSILSQAIILIVALTFYKIKNVGVFSGEGYLKKINAIDLLMSVMLILGVALCFSPLHYDFFDYMTGIFGDLGLEVPESAIDKSHPLFVLVYAFILVPIAPAICEELLFRGVVMRGMAEKGQVFAIIGSSLLFAIMHGSVGMVILQFLLGVAIAIVVTLTKNHVYGCVMHFANNFLIGILTGLPEIINESIPNSKHVVSAFITLFGITFLIVSAYYFFKKYLSKYRKEVLGKNETRNKFEKLPKICCSTINTCNCQYFEMDFDSKIENLKDENTVFLNGDIFVKFNKNSSTKLTYILFSVAVVLAIVAFFI